jgi:fumarate reductase subunit D
MKDQDLAENLDNSEINGAGVDKDEGYAPPKDEEAMIEEGKAAAILGYVPFLCFIPLIKMRDNAFAFRHGKQGLFLFFVEVLAVFFMFDIISNLFWGMLLILSVGSAVAGIFYSIQGKEFTIPFIGDTADKLKI